MKISSLYALSALSLLLIMTMYGAVPEAVQKEPVQQAKQEGATARTVQQEKLQKQEKTDRKRTKKKTSKDKAKQERKAEKKRKARLLGIPVKQEKHKKILKKHINRQKIAAVETTEKPLAATEVATKPVKPAKKAKHKKLTANDRKVTKSKAHSKTEQKLKQVVQVTDVAPVAKKVSRVVPVVATTAAATRAKPAVIIEKTKAGQEQAKQPAEESLEVPAEPYTKNIGEGFSITLMQGNIAEQKTDAIVNVANASLIGGTSIDRAIHEAAGPKLAAFIAKLPESKDPISHQMVKCPVGEVRITPSFDLYKKTGCKYIVHVHAPRDTTPDREHYLAKCYVNALQALDAKNIESVAIESVAFPSIGTGSFGIPIDKAVPIALATIIETVKARKADNKSSLQKILIVISPSAKRTYKAYRSMLEGL